MNPYIIYNGISSEDLDLIIEQLPDEPRPRRNTEEIQVIGRPGRIITDLGSYDMYQTNAKINCNGKAATEVYAWLRGEGWMTTSEDPAYMRWVCFHDQINDSRFRAGACYDTLTVPMRVQPYKYLVEQTPLICTSPAVFDGNGNEPAAPLLEISGIGAIDLMVNGASVMIADLSGIMYLDCDAKMAYTEKDGQKVFAGRQITMVDDWPLLDTGYNSVSWSGDVGYVKITPWWRWL